MEIRFVTNSALLPTEIVASKRRHFEDVFGKFWEDVWSQSPLIDQGEAVWIFEEQGRPAGWMNVEKKGIYSKRFRNFSVHPDFRGRGVASFMLACIFADGVARHMGLWDAGEKPQDIGLMFVKSLVYFDVDRDGEAFAFGKFLRKMGFTSYAYNQNDISPEEVAGIECYRKIYPELAGSLKVFKKKIFDAGVKLREEIKAELLRLTPEARAVVLNGLNWKVGHYAKSGRVSYRYDLCPICAFVGSSEKDSSSCKQCPIYTTCMEPFRAVGRFKEDYEVSGAYFQAVRDFLLANGGER